jgi:hypothetical protein
MNLLYRIPIHLLHFGMPLRIRTSKNQAYHFSLPFAMTVHDRGQTMREWAPKHIVVKLALKNPRVLRLFRPR